MSSRAFLLASALTVAAVAGCYTGSPVDSTRGPSAAVDDGTDTESETPGETVLTPNVAAPTGLPCDVASVLNECSDCHGKTPGGGATTTLLGYDDLLVKPAEDPTRTMAEIALARMKSTTRPMPPTGALPDARIAAFEAWVTSGMPKGSCGESAPHDGGTVVVVPPEPKPDAPPTLTCTSGKTGSGRPGATMRPGAACGSCHKGGDGPVAFAVAGTVYPTLNEPDSCVGVTGTTILIIDAAGVTHTITSNEAGNFVRYTEFPLPYRALVIGGGKIREMKTPQTSGDCNGCHTGVGKNGAPGRVMTP